MNAWQFAQKDLLRLRRDPAGILLWMGIPLLLGALIALASGPRGGPKPVAPVLVAAADSEDLAVKLLTGALDQTGVIRCETVDEASGRARVQRGDGTALLVVPANFARDLLEDKPTTLQLWTNPAQRILPGIVEGVLRVLCDGAFYLQQLLGPQLREITDGPPPGGNTLLDVRVAAIAVQINGLARELVQRLDPLPIELVDKSPEPPEGGSGPGFGGMMWPGILLMSLFFVAQGLGQDLWEERRLGTLRRVMMSPAGISAWLLGKLLCATAVAGTVGVVGLGAGVVIFGLPASSLPLGVPWVALTGAALLLMLWPLVCVASSARAANVLTSAVLFPLLMLGGSFFPFDVMPEWMARVGRTTPNGWLLTRLQRLVSGEPEPGMLLLGAAGVALLGLLVIPFCAQRLRRALAG